MTFIKQILKRLFASDPDTVTAEALYWEIVTLSRDAKLYQKFAIPDTLDGRFDCLMLHLFLVIKRLNALSEYNIAHNLLNFFIKDMDRSLRETGVGDPSISRKMRKIGEAYMGRMNAYTEALDNFDTLYHALHKNIYRNADIASTYVTLLTEYVLSYKIALNQFEPQKPLPNIISTVDGVTAYET